MLAPVAALLLCTVSLFVGLSRSATTLLSPRLSIEEVLGPRLSAGASIEHPLSAVPRWSDYKPLTPGTVVNVASEQDVQQAVKFCIENGISFLAIAGGSGWATTFNIGASDLIINLRGISAIVFDESKTTVTIQGGATVSEVIGVAYINGAQVVTGNCNCIGFLGATLGGGYGRLMGQYGFGVDNLLSLNVVNANGDFQTITPADTDLWWAYRGAGANFGIVTSALVKAYPIPAEQNGAWVGPLVFRPDKLEQLVQVIDKLIMQPQMAIFVLLATSGPPDFTPAIIAVPFYAGTETAGRIAFESVLAIGPLADETAWVPFNQVNAASEGFCVQGGRKPSYGADFQTLNPSTWRAIWNEYVAFLKNPGTEQTAVLLERYSLDKAISFGDDSSSYPWRSKKYNAGINTWYSDPALDSKAQAFGRRVRDLMWSSDGAPSNASYINYANGDETWATIYGTNVARLQALKSQHDPLGRFDQFFPLGYQQP